MTSLRFIRPCSPMPAKKPGAGEGWLHEPKMDGYRLQIAKEGRQVRLYSRGGHEWTKRLAGLAEALVAIPAEDDHLLQRDEERASAWTCATPPALH